MHACHWVTLYVSITFGVFIFIGSVYRQRLCNNFCVSQANFVTTLRSHLDISCYIWSSLLALSLGQRLCINFFFSRANFLTTLRSHFDISCCIWSSLLALLDLSIGQRLCIDFSVSRAYFLTTMRSHLDFTCSSYCWSSSFNVDVNYSSTYLVNHSYFDRY